MNRATARFTCIQGDCPDTCCIGFRVGINADEYERLSQTLPSHPDTADRGALVRLHRAHPLAPNAPGAAATFAQQDGRCVLLDDDGLCAVHRHFGEEELATICSLYPRTVAVVDDEDEVADAGHASAQVFLTLACPEAARLILTCADAFEPAPAADVDAALPPHRRTPHRTLAEQQETVLRPFHRAIEATTLRLEREAKSLREALFFLAVFANALEDSAGSGNAERVEATLAEFAEHDATAVISAQLTSLEPALGASDRDESAVVASGILAARLGQGPHARFAKRAADVLFYDAPTSDEVATWFTDTSSNARGPERLNQQIDDAIQWADAHAPGRIDALLRAMLRHCLATEWWIRSTSPSHQVAVLFVRVLLVRLLFAFDARVCPPPDLANAPTSLESDVVDAAMVDAVQLVAKNISHVPSFARLIELFLEERDRVGLPRVLALLVADETGGGA